MLSLETTPTVVDTSSASLNNSSEETISTQEDMQLSFAQLLKGINTKEQPTSELSQKNIQQQPSQESIQEEKETLLSLLQMSDTEESNTLDQLNTSDLKKLIFDAKEFLKAQIMQSDGYKNAEIKELPSTLKGLSQAAEKLNLNLSSISLEQIKGTPTTISKELQTAQKNQEQSIVQEEENQQKQNLSNTTKDLSTKPSLQEKTTQQLQAHTTQQLVQTKQQKNDLKSSKNSSQTTLQKLLRGEKATTQDAQVNGLNITKDFSKDSAPVVAPQASTSFTKDLESLLHEESTQDGDTNQIKSNQVTPPKADALEVKINEAKQMVRYLSSDVKNAIDDYKAPFTRVKLQLNPQELGKVDLTIVQRGNNLHVNISSNNTAVQTLALNANELKTQLQNNGINNATLNFNNSSQSDSSQSQQHHHQQRHQQKASAEYNYYDDETTEKELYDSLEIVVPYYA